jgi:predicted ribosomally synthesized peptide with nif11-like leader
MVACLAMTENQLQSFLAAIAQDENLKEQLKTVDPVTVAKQAGYTITIEDLSKAKSELSDEDLEKVAGGKVCAVIDLSACLLWGGSLN